MRKVKDEEKFRVPFVWLKHQIEKETEPQLNLTLQYLLHFILKLYYDETRQPLLMKPGFNHFNQKARENKNFANKLIVDEKYFFTELEYKTKDEVKENNK